MHILPPVTAEGFDGSHHPRFAEWGFSLTQSSVIQYGSTLKLDFLFTYFHFEKISSFCSEIGHSRFCVASFTQLLEFSCAPDDFTVPRAQKRSLGRSLLLNISSIPEKRNQAGFEFSICTKCEQYLPGTSYFLRVYFCLKNQFVPGIESTIRPEVSYNCCIH